MADSPIEKIANRKKKVASAYKNADAKTMSDMLVILTLIDSLPKDLKTDKEIKVFLNKCHSDRKLNKVYEILHKRNLDMFISGDVSFIQTVEK